MKVKYQISNLGRVKSLERPYISGNSYRVTKVQPETILKQKKNKTGYLSVLLYGTRRHYPNVHRLVAVAFILNLTNLPCVNHIDGNKTNNIVSNLEWVSYSQNTRHAIAKGLRKDCNMRGVTGGKNKNSKRVYQYTLDGELVKAWECVSDAARFYDINPGSISNCARGLIKTVKKYMWTYAVLKSQD